MFEVKPVENGNDALVEKGSVALVENGNVPDAATLRGVALKLIVNGSVAGVENPTPAKLPLHDKEAPVENDVEKV